MKSLIIAVVVLSALPAAAERRANKPFSTANGRTVVGAPAAPRIITVNTPGGGAAANLPPAAGRAPSVTNDMIYGAPSDGGRAFMGGGRQAMSRTPGRAARRGGKAFRTSGGRSVGADAGGDGGATTTTSAEEAPPHYSKPGALIRTTGQQPVYEKAETRTHTVDAGEIVMNKRKAFNVGRAPSVQQGPKDTPPPPNPGTTGSGYAGGAAANAPAPASGGNDNNGSGNNDKDKPGDDYDQHGGDAAMTTSFYDAF
ncbi:MAG: hypothetical protein NUW21_02325 [Elusimicrobia bacterium]|nr:hypothetical protein [Elusimicrobiota bacterium]